MAAPKKKSKVKAKVKKRVTEKPPKVKEGKSCCCTTKCNMKPTAKNKRKLDQPLPDPNPCIEGMPICPTGVPCVFGRDAAQNLTCWPMTVNERYAKGSQTLGIIWTNT